MSEDEIDRLIREQIICRIAFKGEKYPYLAPFQYVYINGSLYFHFTDYGRKMTLLEKDKRVCVEIESYTKNLSEYRFVVLRGSLKVVKGSQERERVIKRMADEGRRRLSENFLAAHGLRPERGWSSLAQKTSPIIVKLDEVTEKIGLRSPRPQ